MTLVPTPLQTNFFSSACESVPLHKNRIHWVEFLSIPCNYPLLHRWKKHQILKGFAFVVRDEVSFLSLLFLVTNPFHQRALAPSGSFVDSHFYQMDRLRAAFSLVIYAISLFKVVELALLINVH